ncbi:unnamed protein product [Cochlearia groenlandica]
MASIIRPCGACKHLRRKCTEECVFAPHFPVSQLERFKCVHKAYGASNVAKLLNELPFDVRDAAVTAIIWESQTFLEYPVYGCLIPINAFKHRYLQIQHQLQIANTELAFYKSQFPQYDDMAQPHHLPTFLPNPTESGHVSSYGDQRTEQHNGMFTPYGEGSNDPRHHHLNQSHQAEFNYEFDSVPAGSGIVTEFNQLNSGGTRNSPQSWTRSDNFFDCTDLRSHHYEPRTFISAPQSYQPLQSQTLDTQTLWNSETEEVATRRIIDPISTHYDYAPAGSSATVTEFNQLNSGGSGTVAEYNFPWTNVNYHTDQQSHDCHEAQPLLPLQTQNTQTQTQTQPDSESEEEEEAIRRIFGPST